MNTSNVDAVKVVHGALPLFQNGASLESCEAIIEAGLETFYEVGQALAYVRDTELYRAQYVTFHAYLKERWGFSFSWANRLMSSADVVKSLAATPTPPASVAVAEELAPLPTGLREQVWDEAVATTSRVTGGRPNPTAEEVHKLVIAKLAAGSGVGSAERKPRALSHQDQAILDKVRAGATLVASLRIQRELIDKAQEEGLLVRVDRGSRWGNPFILDDDGTREEVILAYRDHYLPHKPSLRSRIGELRGRLLACWCAPEPCHGDVLAELANRWANQ
ncbi:MAG: DUF4326 domain-containing protein [Acidimicrobiales bacterium]